MKLTMGAFIAVVALTMVMPALAQKTADVKNSKTVSLQQGVNSMDRMFLVQAYQGGLAEIETGKLAAQKGTTEFIRNYGRMMVREHSAGNQEIAQMARNHGIDLKANPMPKDQATINKLERLSGTRFDREYYKYVLASHKVAERLFAREIRSGRDADVEALAAKMLPAIQEHYKMAVKKQAMDMTAMR